MTVHPLAPIVVGSTARPAVAQPRTGQRGKPPGAACPYVWYTATSRRCPPRSVSRTLVNHAGCSVAVVHAHQDAGAAR
jgi:hypothetical protein